MSRSRAAASGLCCGTCRRCRRTDREKHSMKVILGSAGVAICIALAGAHPAASQTPEQFYKGKTITVLVGTSPGGINDITARFATKHLSRFIPGNPLVNVQYTPGGG